jgi:uncharacterized membrane protein
MNQANSHSFNIKSWIKFGLVWGFGMMVVMEFLYPLIVGDPLELWMPLLGKSLIWVTGGLLFGYFMKITRSLKS